MPSTSPPPFTGSPGCGETCLTTMDHPMDRPMGRQDWMLHCTNSCSWLCAASRRWVATLVASLKLIGLWCMGGGGGGGLASVNHTVGLGRGEMGCINASSPSQSFCSEVLYAHYDSGAHSRQSSLSHFAFLSEQAHRGSTYFAQNIHIEEAYSLKLLINLSRHSQQAHLFSCPADCPFSPFCT